MITAFLKTFFFMSSAEKLPVGKRDIIFLIDSTMGGANINYVRDFIKQFVSKRTIGPDEVQVGIALFSNAQKIEMDLNTHGTSNRLIAALGAIKPRPGQAVDIGAALDYVRVNMLRPEKGSRIEAGVPQLLMLFTSKTSRDSVDEPVRALRRMGVLTLASGIKSATDQELKKIAIDESFVYMYKDFRGTTREPRVIDQALSTLAGVAVPEEPTDIGKALKSIHIQYIVMT